MEDAAGATLVEAARKSVSAVVNIIATEITEAKEGSRGNLNKKIDHVTRGLS